MEKLIKSIRGKYICGISIKGVSKCDTSYLTLLSKELQQLIIWQKFGP